MSNEYVSFQKKYPEVFYNLSQYKIHPTHCLTESWPLIQIRLLSTVKQSHSAEIHAIMNLDLQRKRP